MKLYIPAPDIRGAMLSLNAERSGNRFNRAKVVKAWHEATWAALNDEIKPNGHKLPEFSFPVVIEAETYHAKGVLGDAGNYIPVVKAAIDALRRAKVIPDDSPQYVSCIHCYAPQRGPNALRLEIL